MRGLHLRAPSAALVVSTVALFVSLGGTGYAAFTLGNNSVGTSQLKNGAVTAKRLRNGAVTAKKLRNGAVTATKLAKGAVTGSKLSLSGVTVPNANHANTATSATSAQNAVNATNAGTLGGQPSTAFEARIRSAMVDQNGNVITQSGGITATRSSTGTYIFGLGQPVSGMSVSALGVNEFDSTSRIDISADPCGTNTALGQVDCGSQFNDGQHFIVFTADSYNSTAGLEDEGFYVDFIS